MSSRWEQSWSYFPKKNRKQDRNIVFRNCITHSNRFCTNIYKEGNLCHQEFSAFTILSHIWNIEAKSSSQMGAFLYLPIALTPISAFLLTSEREIIFSHQNVPKLLWNATGIVRILETFKIWGRGIFWKIDRFRKNLRIFQKSQTC